MGDEDDTIALETSEYEDLIKSKARKARVEPMDEVNPEPTQMLEFVTLDVKELQVCYERGLKPSRITEKRKRSRERRRKGFPPVASL